MDVLDKEDEFESATKQKDFWLYPEFWLIIFGFIYLFVFYNKLGVVSIDKALTAFSVLIVLIGFSRLTYVGLKHKTPKIIWSSGFSTTRGRFYPVGDYAVTPFGAFDAYGLHMDGKDGTLIAPFTAINKIGKSMAIFCRTKIVELDELPPLVREFVIENKFPEPFEFGLIDEEQERNLPDSSILQMKVESLHRGLNEMNDILGTRFKTIEDAVAFASRIKMESEGGGKGFFDKLKERTLDEEKK